MLWTLPKTNASPAVDKRTAADIRRQVQALIGTPVPAWNEVDSNGQPTGVSAALIGIFARFAEIILQRLNQAPLKNFMAFLNLLGAAPLPPQPAQAPLTFSPVPGSGGDGVVPVGTLVAAPPPEGQQEPVVFQTERELSVTTAQLMALCIRDPERDQYACYQVSATGELPDVAVFAGNKASEHALYLGDELLGLPHLDQLTLVLTLAPALKEELAIRWRCWNGADWQKIGSNGSDEDKIPANSGSYTIIFNNVPAIPPQDDRRSEREPPMAAWQSEQAAEPHCASAEHNKGRSPCCN